MSNQSKTSQRRTNKNNKDRGKSFEKRMADSLGWYRVPLSGSNSLFGWCDIRDCDSKEGGIWLGECKTMTPSNLDHKTYTIQVEWLSKLLSRSHEEKKMPMLAFTLYGDTAKFIAMPVSLFNLIEESCKYINPIYDEILIKRQTKNHKNYTIPRDYFMQHKFRAVRREKLNTIVWRFRFDDEISSNWIIVHMNDFIRFYKDPSLNLVRDKYMAIL